MSFVISKGNVIVVDDDQQLRMMLQEFLTGEGYSVTPFDSAVTALDFLKSSNNPGAVYDLVLSDIRMPQMDGFEFVDACKEMGLETPIILMTAFASIPSAIEAIRKGAFDFITKPFKLTEISITLDRAIRYHQLQRQTAALGSDIKKSWQIGTLIGRSPQMQQILDTLPKIADSSTPVLITGEGGTGKEAIARAIHNASSRAADPFVALDSTVLSPSILDVELFGIDSPSRSKKGVLENIGHGTVFINDIGDLDINLQSKILHLIEDKSFTPMGSTTAKPFAGRVIAATRKDLKKAIREKNFREDLYFRISIVPIHLSPLRHRREDIPQLVEYFIAKTCATHKMAIKQVSPKALDILLRMRWEGNITELENTVERMVLLSKSNTIHENDIPMPENENFEAFYGGNVQDFPSLEQLEKRYIQLILEKVAGRKEKAAKILGINRRTLYRKEREYGLVTEDTPEPSDDEN